MSDDRPRNESRILAAGSCRTAAERARSTFEPAGSGWIAKRSGRRNRTTIGSARHETVEAALAAVTPFAYALVRDPEVVALRDGVTVTADPSVRKLEARVTIRLRNGTVLEKHVEHALGTVERPMSDRDLEEKFMSLTDGVLSARAARRVIDLCWRVEQLDDAGELARAAVPH